MRGPKREAVQVGPLPPTVSSYGMLLGAAVMMTAYGGSYCPTHAVTKIYDTAALYAEAHINPDQDF
eukprot:2559342-Rhodomonas_salina.1